MCGREIRHQIETATVPPPSQNNTRYRPLGVSPLQRGIIVEIVSGAIAKGKGSLMNKLLKQLDGRGTYVHTGLKPQC